MSTPCHAILLKACAFLQNCDVIVADDKGSVAFVDSLLDVKNLNIFLFPKR